MAFTDDEILLLHDLDLQLADVAVPTRWSRVRDGLWWVMVAAGSVVAMYVVLQADYGFHATRVAG